MANSRDKKTRADSGAAAARGSAPGAHLRMPLGGTGINLLLHLSTVALLALAFPPLRWTPVAHVALTPMLISIARSPGPWRLAGYSAVAGAVFYAAEMHWMLMISPAAWIGVVLFCLVFWVAFAVLLRWTLLRTGLPLVLLAPVLWVALEWLRSWLLTGFPWLMLGHPQAASAVVRQVVDLTGVYGLSGLSAATAALAADLLTRPLFLRYGEHIRLARSLRIGIAAVAVAWVAVLAYGFYRLQPVETAPGHKVIVVQTNVPQALRWTTPEDVGEGSDAAAETPADEPRDPNDPFGDDGMNQAMRLSREALAEHPDADLLVWPETTVPGYLNRAYLRMRYRTEAQIRAHPEFDQWISENPQLFEGLALARRLQSRSRGYWLAVQGLVEGTRTAALVGALSREPQDDGGLATYNSAILIADGDDMLDVAREVRYDKVHLVPFGEFIPLKRSAPWLYNLLMVFAPYDPDLTHGAALEALAMPGGDVTVAVPICFEDAFADVCRQMVYGPGGGKRADMLANISNDGWFHGTVELEQHWDLSVLRAVENRVPVVRAVNTGISGFIDSTGRTVSRVADRGGRVRSVEGWAVRTVALDPRRTFYGRYGDVAALVLSLAALSIIIIALARPRRS